MQHRYRIIRVGSRGGIYYLVDNLTGKRESLEVHSKARALELMVARNEAEREPAFNLMKARVYLTASDSSIATRTWQDVMEAMVASKETGSENQQRWKRAIKDSALDLIRKVPVIETRAELLLAVLKQGGTSTNVFLRRIQNFCLGMNWLPWPVLPKKLWPAIKYGSKRAIRLEEHLQIVERETNPERRRFYDLCWHLGGSQSDIAFLMAEDIDWSDMTLCYSRKKLMGRNPNSIMPPLIKFGSDCAGVLKQLPQSGPLFPYLRTVRSSDRANEFRQRCEGLGIRGVTLHSYRYSWAERAAKVGMPERQAQQALGHNSKAVHRAYARKAQVTIPSLEDYEKSAAQNMVRVEFGGSTVGAFRRESAVELSNGQNESGSAEAKS